MAQHMKQSAGLSWSVEGGEVVAVREWKDRETGGREARLVLAYWGGQQEIAVPPEDCQRLRALVGKGPVRASGPLSVSENRFGVRVVFGLGDIRADGAGEGGR